MSLHKSRKVSQDGEHPPTRRYFKCKSPLSRYTILHHRPTIWSSVLMNYLESKPKIRNYHLNLVCPRKQMETTLKFSRPTTQSTIYQFIGGAEAALDHHHPWTVIARKNMLKGNILRKIHVIVIGVKQTYGTLHTPLPAKKCVFIAGTHSSGVAVA